MKEASWANCLETCNAKLETPDPAKAKSLTETARARLDFLKQPVNEANANFIFEGMYSSLLELLHAHLLRQGYKVENHICVGFYLRDVLKQPKLFRDFDDCRYKRNSLVYYGKQMPLAVAEESIEKLTALLQAVNEL
jgi:hypothetical protein